MSLRLVASTPITLPLDYCNYFAIDLPISCPLPLQFIPNVLPRVVVVGGEQDKDNISLLKKFQSLPIFYSIRFILSLPLKVFLHWTPACPVCYSYPLLALSWELWLKNRITWFFWMSFLFQMLTSLKIFLFKFYTFWTINHNDHISESHQ